MYKTYLNNRIFFLIFLGLVFSDCTKDDPAWTLEKILPKVKTLSVSDISANSATINVQLIHDGGYDIIEKGVCYSLAPNPTIDNSTKVLNSENVQTFLVKIQNISESSTYYVRSFAKNKKGVSYGESLQFTTKGLGKVTTQDATNINHNSATLNGNAISNGQSTISSMGFFIGETQDKIDQKFNITTNVLGPFTRQVTNIKTNTTYYFRAYIETANGSALGEIKSFKTLSSVLPTVTTGTPVALSSISFNCTGNVTMAGSSSVTSRGICYSTSASPTTSSSTKYSGSGIGQFTVTVDFLSPGGITYYIRAFAISDVGTTYGNQVTFTTGSCNPSLSTVPPTSITQNSATSGGTITSNGGFNITSKGVIWSTSQNPTISLSTKTNNGSGSGSFTSQITGLTANTRYYIRSYATNSCGTSYGLQESFTTSNPSSSGTITVGNGTLVESGTVNPITTPFGTYFTDTRHTYLIRASEMQNAGGSSGNISHVSFNVTSASNINVNNFALRIGTTTNNILDENTTYSFDVNTTYQTFNMASFSLGWIEFPLSSSFYWNGSRNIVIEVCFDNIDFNTNSLVQYSTLGYKCNFLAFKDNASGCSLNWEFYSETRPNMRFRFN
ncbi:MAG: hypothetical protein IT267_09700 [Saprospiraceae bacterium]|nr:hypothetical protein [Saprospiraceae bacterium]